MPAPAIRILLCLFIGVQAVFAQPNQSVYLSFYRPSVTSTRSLSESSLSGDMINQKIKRNGLSIMLGVENQELQDFFGSFGGFFGYGALGDDIGEFIIGIDIKKMFWILKDAIAIPISLGFAARAISDDNQHHIPDGYYYGSYHYSSYRDNSENTIKFGADMMPSIDLQYFIEGRFSFYIGYMYRINIFNDYNISIKEEKIFKIPGTFRFGVKLHEDIL